MLLDQFRRDYYPHPLIGFVGHQNILRKSFYGIIALCILLLAPHIYWQIKNDYPSLQYHLFERSMKSYRIDFTLNYLHLKDVDGKNPLDLVDVAETTSRCRGPILAKRG